MISHRDPGGVLYLLHITLGIICHQHTNFLKGDTMMPTQEHIMTLSLLQCKRMMIDVDVRYWPITPMGKVDIYHGV